MALLGKSVRGREEFFLSLLFRELEENGEMGGYLIARSLLQYYLYTKGLDNRT